MVSVSGRVVQGEDTRVQTTWRAGRPVPLAAIVGTLRRGAGDPTFRYDRGSVWRALRTPLGPATLHLVADAAAGEVHGVAWGAGRHWTLDHVPRMLGAADDLADDFVREHGRRHSFLAHALRLQPHYRVQQSGLVFEATLAAALEQKVTGQEAFAGWRRLVRRFGEPAPGPGNDIGLWVAPGPEVVRTIASWEWLRLPVDPARSRVAVTAARVAPALERTLGLPGDEVEHRLTPCPGVGDVDCGRGAPAGPRRPRCGQLRRLPRAGDGRLRASGGARRRRGNGRAAGAVPRPPVPGAAAGRAVRRPPTPASTPDATTTPPARQHRLTAAGRRRAYSGSSGHAGRSTRIQPRSGTESWQVIGKPSPRPHAVEPGEWKSEYQK